MTTFTKRIAAIGLGLVLGVVTVPLKAQFIVHDPASYFELCTLDFEPSDVLACDCVA